MASGDPAGAVAPRLPEDSCVNEAHYAVHEYMVLCIVLEDWGDRPDNTVYDYSIIILKSPH